MKWREAKSLVRLLEQINEKFPDRSKVSDGELGDTAHSHRASDHNPNADGVVCALDVTNDPLHGLVSRKLAQALIDSKDDRIKYVISNRQICAGNSGPSPWTWRPYTGANPHEHHVHISVKSDAKHYDDNRDWDLVWPIDEPTVVDVIKEGSTRWLQTELNKHGAHLQVDGHEGELTQAATRAFAVEQLKKA